MKRYLHWIQDHILLLLTLFLLVFIPLYPKFPLLDIKHTWVYIRIEDFILAFIWGIFFLQLIRKKATLKTPLSIPIVAFWLVGGLATLHGVLFIFPRLEGVFPQLALLHWLRHVEYLSVFFLGFSAMRKKSFVTPVVITIAVTMIAVFLYGLGQRYLGFPAFLTMNEEFAKGIPLRLSPLARIPSTFAGHYDLAAYLALLIPVMGSMVIGFKKWYAKIFFFLTALSGLILLLLTASRVSYGVYLISITLLLVLQRQKKYILPVIIASIILLQAFPGLSSRFASTFQQVDLVVDSRSGKAIGVASEFGDGKIVIEDEQSTGENLPGGSKYINIPTQTGDGTDTEILYKSLTPGSNQPHIISRSGKVIVKKAFAYDVSFTTRFQGEWPRALEALNRNMILGSGYSSINVATDNNFLRILGEIGILGLASFLAIFLTAIIYMWRVLPSIHDPKARALVMGVFAGLIGVTLNAILIDVFEASKLAFVLWTVLGVTLGVTKLYQEKEVHILREFKRVFLSPIAAVFYLVAVGFGVLAQSLNNYFVADDFTWLRWAADCSTRIHRTCEPLIPTILSFFTDAQGFYYRPGMKTLFYLAYPVFEIFPTPYHIILLSAHIASSVLIFFLSRKFLKSSLYGFITAALFLILSIHFETLYWISTLGHVVSSMFILFSLLCFVYFVSTKNRLLLIPSWLSLLVATFFHEFAFIGAILIILYDIAVSGKSVLKKWPTKYYYLFFLFLIPIYFILRSFAHSLVFSGDYSYNIAKFPLNAVGNFLGYIFLILLGPWVLPVHQQLRSLASSQLAVSFVLATALVAAIVYVIYRQRKKLKGRELSIPLIALIIFTIPLLPFLGLGNVSPRYTYLASFGICLLVVYAAQKVMKGVDTTARGLVVGLLLVALSVYAYLNISTLWSLNKDWQKAGEIASNTLVGVALSSETDKDKLTGSPIFYFINIPIRYGTAWVFPVGLTDAIWFTFHDAKVFSIPTSEENAVQEKAKENPNVKVFKFLEDKSVVEYTPPTPTPTLIPNL